MKPKSYKNSHMPNPLLYGFVKALARLFMLCFGYHRHGAADIPKKGGLLVLSSHQGLLDFLMTALAFKRRINFVCTERFFSSPLLAKIFHLGGVIPKVQFHPDPRSIATVLRLLRGGAAVGIFPAGQTSMCGTPANISGAIVRLAKKAAVPVAAARLDGGFFAHSRFGAFNLGQCHATVKIILTVQQLKELSDADILETIRRELYYDDFAWQAKSGARFHGAHRARGYEHILYSCPKCGAEFQMQSHGNSFSCKSCGFGVSVNTDFSLTSKAGDAPFLNMAQWYAAQEKAVCKSADSPDFFLEAPCSAQTVGSDIEALGNGFLRMNRDEIWYDGTLGSEAVRLATRHAILPGLCAKPGHFIEIFDEKYNAVRYSPDIGDTITKFKIAQEYLYLQSLQTK